MINFAVKKSRSLARLTKCSGVRYLSIARYVIDSNLKFCSQLLFVDVLFPCCSYISPCLFSGAHGVGRRHIKNTLITQSPERFAYPIPRKYIATELCSRSSKTSAICS